MNILKKYTIRTLKKNKMRTLMTILGIVLSMSLFTAVILGAQSGVEFIRNIQIGSSGHFHAYFYDISDEDIQRAKEMREISDSSTWQEVGWADIPTDREEKSKLLIQSIDDDFTKMVSVRLAEGRMPENENEIIIPTHVEPYLNEMYRVGDTVEIEISKRIDGEKRIGFTATSDIAAEKENFISVGKKQYTVVGIYHRISTYIETYDALGYIALTKGGGTGGKTLFFTVKDPKNFEDFIAKQDISKKYKTHGILLKMYGSFNTNMLSQFMYSLATILIFIISLGSITLIYNSFSISVSERTKQYGVMKSIGATKKQIRRSVLFEAMILSLIAIPAGIVVGTVGIGTTLWAMKDAFAIFANISISDAVADDVAIKLAITPTGILVAAIICLLTTLISAYIPAFRAMRLQPIDAIRQIKDVKINPKRVKVSFFTKKLFGFESMMASKNFKRNKKNYRATVISLFLSIVLFVSATSLNHSLKSSFNILTAGETSSDLFLNLEERKHPGYRTNQNLPEDFQESALLADFEQAREISKINTVHNVELTFEIQNEFLSDDYKNSRNAYIDEKSDSMTTTISVVFADDDVFNEICRKNQLNAEEYYDKAAPKAILYNYFNTYTQKAKIKQNSLFHTGKLPFRVNFMTYKRIDGYYPWKFEKDHVEYYELSYLKEYMYRKEEDKKLDQSKALIFSKSEVEEKTEIEIAESIEELPRIFFRGNVYIFYPKRMMDIVLKPEIRDRTEMSYSYYFKTEHPQKAHVELNHILVKHHLPKNALYNMAENRNAIMVFVDIINIFALGFVIIISLIAAANVFNTISTNILLRRREFANLKSIGLGKGSFKKMMIYECIIYGLKGIFWGVPVSLLISCWIHTAVQNVIETPYTPPLMQIGIAVASVLLICFSTMIYAVKKIEKDNLIEALRNENL